MQELACYAGQQAVFEEASQMLQFIGGVEINAKQIERICHYHGQKLEETLQQEIQSGLDKTYPDASERYYVMVDGSMYLTREEKWKEMKLGRIFKAQDNIGVSKHRGMITKSEYVCHLGTHTDFFEKLSVHIESLKQPIFINDGARWIWNWIDTHYPNAVQILDYFHAKEHLCQFASEYFCCPNQAKEWIKEQSDSLLNDGVEKLIVKLQQLPIKKARHGKLKRILVEYYRNNIKRMQYKTFSKQGFLIGSGAIESAHRDILQQRLKLSGQRWTKQGIQQIANLRALYKANKMGDQRQLIKFAA